MLAKLPILTLAAPPSLLSAVRDLPWGVHAAIAIALIAGLVLWCSGRRVLKPVVACLAALAGGSTGLVMLPVLAPDAGVSPWFGGAGGAIIGLLAGILLYRIVLALLFGAVLAGAAAMFAAAALSFVPPTPAAAHAPADSSSTGSALVATDDPPAIPTPPLVATWLEPVEPRDVAKTARGFMDSLRWQAGLAWDESTLRSKVIVGGAAIIGFLTGLLLGLTLPKWAAGAVTALAGAGIWLPAGAWLLHAANIPGREHLELPPTGWAIIWFVVALLGVAVQWMGLMGGRGARASRGKPASEA